MLIDTRGEGRPHRIDVADGFEPVLSVRTWAELTGISYSLAKRLVASGEGPQLTRISAGRVGIRASAHKRWLAERTKA